ncbi:hypothetical protein [Longirhabdus pacifica]|uniref:hypothetical protein n=1 Tax=Longirhabdus pacifica TaxID=2305227 RepID=UPI001008BA01|nr:hypothetical protein [Longirhabdus pacifica]
MNDDKQFYLHLFQDSGLNDHTYHFASKSIITDTQLSETQKLTQLQLMNEAFEQTRLEDITPHSIN